MYGIYAKFLQMLYSLRLCQRQKLTFIHKARRRVDREVTVVHLIYNEVGRTYNRGYAVGVPSFGISGRHVYDGCSLSVYAHCLGKHSGALSCPGVKGVELAFQVAFKLGRICLGCRALHLNGLHRLAALSVVVYAQRNLLCIVGSKELKTGKPGSITSLAESLCTGLWCQ